VKYIELRNSLIRTDKAFDACMHACDKACAIRPVTTGSCAALLTTQNMLSTPLGMLGSN
jgi:hypothetical protein